MNTFYLHGLESKLSDEKRLILEQYSDVIAPDMDYRGNSQIFAFLKNLASKSNINVFIGSSMGGLMAYHLSKMFNIPSLIFNPALPFKSIGPDIPEIETNRSAFLKVIIGGQDDVVLPLVNFDWILNHEKGDFEIKWNNLQGHQTPVEIFEVEVKTFFEKIQS